MLLLWSANLEKGCEQAFKDFVCKNIETYRRHSPPGWSLVGVYGSTFNIGPYDVTWVWKFSKFADMDAAREYSDPVLDRLAVEEMDLYLPGSANTVILREVEDWSVTAPKKPRKRKK